MIKQATEKNAAHLPRRRLWAAGLAAVCLLVGLGVWVWGGIKAPAGGEGAPQKAASSSAPADAVLKEGAPARRRARRGRARRPLDAAPTRTVVRPDIIDPSSRAAGNGSPADAGGADAKKETPWQDPTHRRVLGPRSWMAPVPAQTRQKIEQIRDAPPPAPRYPVDLAVRRESIELARAVARECFADHPPHGRFALHYDLVTDGQQARFLNVAFTNRFALEDPLYFECLARELSALNFATVEQGTMRVSYPISFEGVVLP